MTKSRIASALVAALLAAGLASAQTTGNLRGTVTDDTGAVLPGASVTIFSAAIIGGSRSDVTNEVGVYRFPALSVGTYTVEVSMDGFETYRVEGAGRLARCRRHRRRDASDRDHGGDRDRRR